MKLYVLVLNIILITIAAARVSKKKSDHYDGEYGHYFEGDMILTDEQHKMFKKAKIRHDREEGKRILNGLIDVTRRWPKATVVYYFNYRFDEHELQKIKNAMKHIENETCIKFREKTHDKEYAVAIQRENKYCSSHVGYAKKTKKHQEINLGEKCFKHGKLVHEMLHTLGFYHMHSNFNRDNYVTIVWDNIKINKTKNFIKYLNDVVTDFGMPYDYGSVMHYSKRAFSKNGRDTIIPKKKNAKIGQRERLSESDIKKLNIMYNCKNE